MNCNNAKDIAKILINKCYELNRDITNLKLQKLLYFAQGFYTKENDGNFLFVDDFQAWAHGPVIPEVYRQYKDNMWFTLPKQEIININCPELDSFFDRLLAKYGANDGKELEITSHSEKPWIDARQGLRDYQPSSNLISKESIKNYYLNTEENLN